MKKDNFSKQDQEYIEKIKPYATQDMGYHTKTNLAMAIKIMKQTIERNKRNSSYKKKDIFGDGSNFTSAIVYRTAATLISASNNWHNGAAACHILAMMMSKWYRMVHNYMWDNQFYLLHINDYIKVTKRMHEIIRRMGVDWKG